MKKLIPVIKKKQREKISKYKKPLTTGPISQLIHNLWIEIHSTSLTFFWYLNPVNTQSNFFLFERSTYCNNGFWNVTAATGFAYSVVRLAPLLQFADTYSLIRFSHPLARNIDFAQRMIGGRIQTILSFTLVHCSLEYK